MKNVEVFSYLQEMFKNPEKAEALKPNFEMHCKEHRKIRDAKNPDNVSNEINYELVYADGATERTTIPLSEIKSAKAHKRLPERCMLCGISNKVFNLMVQKATGDFISATPPVEQIACHQGFNRLEDKTVLCLGNRTLNGSDNGEIVNNSNIEFKEFRYDKNYIDYIVRLIESNVFPPVLLLSTISAFTKRLAESKGNGNYGFTNYVYGNTGCGKTFITNLYTNIFKNADNIASLSSEKLGIKQLSVFSDIPICVDDLCKTVSSRDKNTREAKLCDFIQLNQGTGNSMYKGINAKMNNVAFVSAEYVLKNPSTLNRCLMIHLDKEIDSNEIRYLEECHNKYLSFLVDFLEWVCQNYNDLEIKIQNVFGLYALKQQESSKNYLGWDRVMRTRQILYVSLFLFKTFLYEHHGLHNDDISKLTKKLEDSIEYCISDTLENIKINDDSSDMTFVTTLISEILYPQIEEIVTEDLKEYSKSIKQFLKHRGLPKKIFYYYSGYLCVYGDMLVRWLKQSIGLTEIPTKQRVSNQLKKHNLLLYVGGEVSIPLQSREKFKHKLYHISLQQLMNLDRLEQMRTHGEIVYSNYDLSFYENPKSRSDSFGRWGNYSEKNDKDESDNYYNDDDDYDDSDYDDDDYYESLYNPN